MPSGITGVPDNALTALIDAGGGAPDLPPVDPAMLAMERGMSEGGDDSPPAIHITGGPGGIHTIAEPSRDQPRMRARQARLGAPPQPVRYPDAPYQQYGQQYQQPPAMQFPPPVAPPMPTGAGLQVLGIDMMRSSVITNFGLIPLPADANAKITKLAITAMQHYFADQMKQTMQVYGMGGGKRVKRKRPRKKTL